MGYYKDLWIRREQERAERAQEEHLVRAGQTMLLLVAQQAPAGQQPTPTASPYAAKRLKAGKLVSDCIRDIDLRQKTVPRCQLCSATGWIAFVLQDNPGCGSFTALMDSVWKCTPHGHKTRLEGLLRLQTADYVEIQHRVHLWLTQGLLQHYPPPAPPKQPRGIKAIMEQSTPGGEDWDMDVDPCSLDAELVREHEAPKDEVDKPEGTRDVDKFLKEQQNKLWKGVV